MGTVAANTESSILGRLLDFDRQRLTPDAARYILSIDFPDSDRQQMKDLAAKAREDELNEDERRQLESFIHVADLLALWHSKARRILKQNGDQS